MHKTLLILIILFLAVANRPVLAEEETSSVPSDFLEVISPQLRSKMESQLNQNISVHFDNVHVREILQYITTISGLSIIIDETPFQYESSSPVPEPSYDSIKPEDLSAFSEDIKQSKYIINIHLNDIPLKKALWYLCQRTGLMAFFDEDIDEYIPGPVVVTSQETAKKIIAERIAKSHNKKKIKKALSKYKRY